MISWPLTSGYQNLTGSSSDPTECLCHVWRCTLKCYEYTFLINSLYLLYGNYSMRSHENYKYFSVSWESASTLNGAKPPEKCPHYTDWHSFQLDTLSQVWNHETHRTTYKCMHRYTHWDILYKFTVRCQQTCIYTQIFIECSGTLRQTVGILPHTVKHWYWQLKHAPEYFIFSCSLVSQSHY